LTIRGCSTSTAIFIAGFLTLLTICIFFVGNFLDTNLASLSLQWTFLLWLSVFFVPAFGMRAFGSRKASNEMNLLLSYPFLPIEIVLGKWLGGLCILCQVLFLTFPMVITIGVLGKPDWGVVISGYIGGFFVLGLMYAVAILASAIAKDEVSSFLLGSCLLFALIFLDVDALKISALPDFFEQITRHTFVASPAHWFAEFTSGKVGLFAALYFMILTAICLWLSSYQIDGYRRTSYVLMLSPSLSAAGIFVFAGLIGIVLHSTSTFDLKLDLTDAKEHTLSAKTLQLAKKSSDGTKITLYVSSDKSQIPQKIIKHMDRVERLIDALEVASDGKIEASVVTLDLDSQEADKAENAGIGRIPMSSGDEFYFGMVAQKAERSLTTTYLDVDHAASLEYDIALQLSNLGRSHPPKIAILSSVLKPSNVRTAHPGLSIIEELKRQYDVSVLPYFAEVLDEQYDVLIIFDAPVIRRSMLEAIDKHIQRGDSAILMLDPYQRMNEANSRLEIERSIEGEINSIVDLLRFYGIEFSENGVVGDFENAANVETGNGRNFAYPYWLRIRGTNLMTEEPVVANLNELLFAETGHFSGGEESNFLKPIVITGKQISIQRSNFFGRESTEELALSFDGTVQAPKIIVGRVNEQLPSPFLPENSINANKPASLVLVGDTDWLYDGFSRSSSGSSAAALSRPINDNHNLFLNLVELSAGSDELLEIRSRKSPVRVFSRVEEMLFASREKYHAKEQDFASNISSAEENITQFLRLANVNNENDLPQALKVEVRKIREMIYPLKEELRKIRLQMRQGVDELFQTVLLLNLLTGPVFTAVFIVIFRGFRRTFQRVGKL
jgi:ABC-2 type transport system permease protein